MAAQVLGGAVHHDVGAEGERIAQIGAGHGVVDDEGQAVLVRDAGDGLDVQHVDQRIAQRLAVHGAGVGADGAAEVVRVFRVDEGGLYAQAREADAELPDAAAVQRGGGDDVVAGLEDRQQRRHLRRHAGRAGQRGPAAFERSDALLQHRHRRIADAAVDVAEGLQVEQAGGVLGRVEHETGGLVDRRGARAGDRVRHRAGVDGSRAESVLVVFAHVSSGRPGQRVDQ